MKNRLFYIALSIMVIAGMASCSKSRDNSTPAPTYAATQGVITGTSGAVFSTSGTQSSFTRVVDTVYIHANIDGASGTYKQFMLAFEKPTTGTFSFNDIVSNIHNPAFNATSFAEYSYETQSTGGTITAHLFFVKSGSYTITYSSATGITGTYTAVMNDANSNGDAPVTVTGTFSGNY